MPETPAQRIKRCERVIQQLRDELKEQRGNLVPAELVAALVPGAIERERSDNWVHFHPELFCHLCGRRNMTSWFAPSDLWNEIANHQGGTIDGEGIICPLCFIERYEERVLGSYKTWKVSLDA